MKLFLRLTYCLLVLAAFNTLVGASTVTAQSPDGHWTTPQLIVATNGSLASSNLGLVADRAGQLHLFYPHQPEGTLPISIDYVRWDGLHWSEPIDILVDPPNALSLLHVAIDDRDTLHMVWLGGNEQLQYARVPLLLAGESQQWLKPTAIADAIGESDLIADSDGALFVAYSESSATGAIVVIRSYDGGNTWVEPVIVASSIPGRIPDEPKLAIDETGRVHIAWTEYMLPARWPPVATYYSQSDDGGEQWSSQVQISEGSYAQIGVAAVGYDEVHLVWRSTAGGDGTFHRWSNDGGLSWLKTDQFSDNGGVSGMPSFAVDSAQRLHYAIGPGKATTWENERLDPYLEVYGDLEKIEKLHEAVNEVNRREPFQIEHPERAKIAITQGNQSHVVFETGFNTLWHTTRMLGVASVPTATLSLDNSNLSSPVATATQVATLVPEPEQPPDAVPLTRTYTGEMDVTLLGPGAIILLAIAPVGLLVASVMAIRLLFSRQS